ncbi:serine/threonine-protein kinase [Streptomyces sp. NPDC087897]|uniref:serine/threonine-protein kinase n=1 Tax=Streptomyces sp. NPDC087897 TaxID=3365817 RepID=UPI0038213DBD
MTEVIARGVRLAQGRFVIEELLGTGGMASVHRARDTVLGRTVAIKTMNAASTGDPTGRERFRREARAAAALSHAHVVAVHDVLEEEVAGARVPYLVMEYVEGRPLSRFVPSAPGGLPLGEALRYTAEILDALAASHDSGLVHRDVKPANVMVTVAGSVKVMDFGIARALDAQHTALTGTGFIVGTPHYMAPEQFESGNLVDARSDLYAVGIILFQLLTGSVPFTADSGFRIGYLHVTADPPALTTLGARVPAEVQALLTRALAKNPAERFPNARAMRDQVLSVSRTAASAGTPGTGHPDTVVDRPSSGHPAPPGPALPAPAAAAANAPTGPAAAVLNRPAFVPRLPPGPPPAPAGSGDVLRRMRRGLGHPLLWLLAFVPLGVYGMVLDHYDTHLRTPVLTPEVLGDIRTAIPAWAEDDWWGLPLYGLLLAAAAALLYVRLRLDAADTVLTRAWSVAVGVFWIAVCAAWWLHAARFTALDDAIQPIVQESGDVESFRYTGLFITSWHSASLVAPAKIACLVATPVVLFGAVLRFRHARRTATPGGSAP